MADEKLEEKSVECSERAVQAEVGEYISISLGRSLDSRLVKGNVLIVHVRPKTHEEIIVFSGMRDEPNFKKRRYFRTIFEHGDGIVAICDYRTCSADNCYAFERYDEHFADLNNETNLNFASQNPVELIFYAQILKEARRQ